MRGRTSSQRLGQGGVGGGGRGQPLSSLGLSLGLSQRFIFSEFLLDGWKHSAYCSPRDREASQLAALPPGPPISHSHKSGLAL